MKDEKRRARDSQMNGTTGSKLNEFALGCIIHLANLSSLFLYSSEHRSQVYFTTSFLLLTSYVATRRSLVKEAN